MRETLADERHDGDGKYGEAVQLPGPGGTLIRDGTLKRVRQMHVTTMDVPNRLHVIMSNG